MPRLENLLGAWSLAVADRMTAAGREAGLSASDQAAVTTLLARPDRTVSWLGEVLALTSSGSTRLVDRLVAAGWVVRSPGSDTRQRRLRLTADGEALARRVVRDRAEVLAACVAPLDDRARDHLERALERMVEASTDAFPEAMRTCRLCDRGACRAGGRACPLDHTKHRGDSHD
ncbi:MarR family winged helix-turn-helix transcriptional regulator [Nocardioides sp. YIM 152315]|uniref:MarR family winged helix-turn-helix transcriptional regulator n=1 Tax=Nocardioides sp. YIM 152315 TaxID=3031760 RepID=UPI0023DCC3DA|nr:MarR family winged helix-turn-helix transcriptional regulator [Nocardioides sp. YIM 152315]MDF1604745.1 MarR family winged helix-turn-helix transcriptional regulator [Nocardioides sp. YIM 152315]